MPKRSRLSATGSAGRGRARPYPAVAIRRWVTEYASDPRGLHQALEQKRATIARLVRDPGPPAELVSPDTPATAACYGVPGSRLIGTPDRQVGIGFATIAAHCERHGLPKESPYSGRPAPRMVWSVPPWDLRSPASITVLDLPTPLLRRAAIRSRAPLVNGRPPCPIRRYADLGLGDLTAQVRNAARFVALEPVAAAASPYTLGLRHDLTRRMLDDQLDRSERATARRLLLTLDQAGDVDFVRAPTRRVRGLLHTERRYRDLRDRLLRDPDLQDNPRLLAYSILAEKRGCSEETIRQRVTEGAQWRAILRAWRIYRARFAGGSPRGAAPEIPRPA